MQLSLIEFRKVSMVVQLPEKFGYILRNRFLDNFLLVKTFFVVNFIKSEEQAFHNIKLNSTNLCHDPNVASCWIIDSGAVSHMINNPSYFSQPKSYKCNDKVMVCDGKFLPILQTGDVILDTNYAKFHLHDVLYVLSIKENLLSFAKFTKENFVSFDKKNPWGYEIKDLETKAILAEGLIKENLYPL